MSSTKGRGEVVVGAHSPTATSPVSPLEDHLERTGLAKLFRTSGELGARRISTLQAEKASDAQ